VLFRSGEPLDEAVSGLGTKPGTEVGTELEPAHAACGTTGPNLDNRRVNDASSPNTANQRTGSSTGCAAPGALQPTDDALYFCWTQGNDGFTWTYLQNLRTGVRGWVRDDLLRLVDNIRGAKKNCSTALSSFR
jgi:hypothetical protein